MPLLRYDEEYLCGEPFEASLDACEEEYRKKNKGKIACQYAYKGGLNIPSIYHSATHQKLDRGKACREGVQYTFRPHVCNAPGLYQPFMTVNVPHRVWDDTCYIQEKERLNQVVYNYNQNLNKQQRRGVLLPPTSGVGIRADRFPGLHPGQKRSEFYMQGKGKALNHCPGDTPNLSPDPRDSLHSSQKRKDSGLYMAHSMNRRGMIATKEINPFERIGVTAKGPPTGGYAAMQYRQGFLHDTYQEVVDATERMIDELYCDQPRYY